MSEFLTEREKAVLIELMRGKSNRGIAKKLYISLSTVKAHISSVFQKLKVKNRVEAAVKGVFLLNLLSDNNEFMDNNWLLEIQCIIQNNNHNNCKFFVT